MVRSLRPLTHRSFRSSAFPHLHLLCVILSVSCTAWEREWACCPSILLSLSDCAGKIYSKERQGQHLTQRLSGWGDNVWLQEHKAEEGGDLPLKVTYRNKRCNHIKVLWFDALSLCIAPPIWEYIFEFPRQKFWFHKIISSVGVFECVWFKCDCIENVKYTNQHTAYPYCFTLVLFSMSV